MNKEKRMPDWLILTIRIVWCAAVLPLATVLLIKNEASVWGYAIIAIAWLIIFALFFFVITTSSQEERKIAVEKADNGKIDRQRELDEAVANGAENKPSDAVCIIVRIAWFLACVVLRACMSSMSSSIFLVSVLFVIGWMVIRANFPTSRQRTKRYLSEKKEREYLEKKYGKKDQE